jgi:riboflavin biosynthesis pyrimidine reductase
VTNGAFLRAGLVSEISLAIFPSADGAKGAPSVFDSHNDEAGAPAPVRAISLDSSEVLEGGGVWLRYRVENGLVARTTRRGRCRWYDVAVS